MIRILTRHNVRCEHVLSVYLRNFKVMFKTEHSCMVNTIQVAEPMIPYVLYGSKNIKNTSFASKYIENCLWNTVLFL